LKLRHDILIFIEGGKEIKFATAFLCGHINKHTFLAGPFFVAAVALAFDSLEALATAINV
jgi:hypothetical protein